MTSKMDKLQVSINACNFEFQSKIIVCQSRMFYLSLRILNEILRILNGVFEFHIY